MSASYEYQEKKVKGTRGEVRFRGEMNALNVPYLWIDQQPETKSPYLGQRIGDYSGKRPDAVTVSQYGKPILVEVKNKQLAANGTGKYFTLDEKEAKKLLATEETLNQPILLAYRNNQTHENKWYAIYLEDALSKGMKIDRNGGYYQISLKEFKPLVEMIGASSLKLQRELFA